jgi:hypothetical protein
MNNKENKGKGKLFSKDSYFLFNKKLYLFYFYSEHHAFRTLTKSL